MDKETIKKFCESAKKQIEELTTEASELLQELTGLKKKEQAAAAARDRCLASGDMGGFTAAMENIAGCRSAGVEKLARLNAIPAEAREIQRGISPHIKVIGPLEQAIANEIKAAQQKMVEMRELRTSCHHIGDCANRAVTFIEEKLGELGKDL